MFSLSLLQHSNLPWEWRTTLSTAGHYSGTIQCDQQYTKWNWNTPDHHQQVTRSTTQQHKTLSIDIRRALALLPLLRWNERTPWTVNETGRRSLGRYNITLLFILIVPRDADDDGKSSNYRNKEASSLCNEKRRKERLETHEEGEIHCLLPSSAKVNTIRPLFIQDEALWMQLLIVCADSLCQLYAAAKAKALGKRTSLVRRSRRKIIIIPLMIKRHHPQQQRRSKAAERMLKRAVSVTHIRK